MMFAEKMRAAWYGRVVMPLGRVLSLGLLSCWLTVYQSHATAESPDAISPYAFTERLSLPEQDDSKANFGHRIQRTMHLLASSTKAKPNKVKILFFGQSITRQNYSREIIEAKLRAEYPHAQLEVYNHSIGGYTAPLLLPTMHHQLIPLQPDLVVFHVYGGETGEYEAILRNIRQLTTAEIITMSHHLDDYGAKVTEERERASDLRRDLAERYQCEFVELRREWGKYLARHALEPSDLLKDRIHLNRHGGELWGALQARHFQRQASDTRPWESKVARIDLSQANRSQIGHVEWDENWERDAHGIFTSTPGATLRIAFQGSRLDVVSLSGQGRAEIRVDGRKPSEIPSTWAATLPSPTSIDYRPAIRHVEIIGQPRPEQWTLSAEAMSADGTEFSYRLDGSISGFQGSGNHVATFESVNGVIKLSPEHFGWSHAIKIKGQPLAIPEQTSWKLYPTSLDEWQFSAEKADNPSGQITLVQQLKNGSHRLEIRLKSGSLHLSECLIFRPSD